MATPADNLDACAAALAAISTGVTSVVSGISTLDLSIKAISVSPVINLSPAITVTPTINVSPVINLSPIINPVVNIESVVIDFTLVIKAIESLENTVNGAIGFATSAIVSELESLGMLVNGAIGLASSTTNSMLSNLRLMLGSLVMITDDASKNRGGGGGGGDGGGGGGGKQPSMKSFLDSLKGGLVSGIIESVNQGFMIFKKAKDLFKQAGGGGAGAKGGGNGMPPAMVGPMAAVTGVASAIGGLASGFMTLIEMVGKFVGSLDPALMQQLNLAFENLSAVIGTGLRPLVSMAVVVIKAFGDALVPVMKQLEPVMTKLSMVIINMVVPYIIVWADQIETLIPVIEALFPVIGFFGDLLLLCIKAVIPPFKVLAGVLMIVIGVFDLVVSGIYILLAAFFAATGELKSWVPGMGDSSKADKQMAKDMVEKSKNSAQAAGKAMVGGANLIIDGVENAFGLDSTNKKEKPKPGGAEGAAAKGASFSGVADLGKNMMQAAFGSSTANVANEQLNQQKQMNQQIEKIGGWLFGWAKPKEAAAGVRK